MFDIGQKVFRRIDDKEYQAEIISLDDASGSFTIRYLDDGNNENGLTFSDINFITEPQLSATAYPDISTQHSLKQVDKSSLSSKLVNGLIMTSLTQNVHNLSTPDNSTVNHLKIPKNSVRNLYRSISSNNIYNIGNNNKVSKRKRSKSLTYVASRGAIPTEFNTKNKYDNEEITTINFNPLAGNCQKCNKITIYRCSRCNVIYYCSRICQRKHWKNHQNDCLKRLFIPIRVPIREDVDKIEDIEKILRYFKNDDDTTTQNVTNDNLNNSNIETTSFESTQTSGKLYLNLDSSTRYESSIVENAPPSPPLATIYLPPAANNYNNTSQPNIYNKTPITLSDSSPTTTSIITSTSRSSTDTSLPSVNIDPNSSNSPPRSDNIFPDRETVNLLKDMLNINQEDNIICALQAFGNVNDAVEWFLNGCETPLPERIPKLVPLHTTYTNNNKINTTKKRSNNITNRDVEIEREMKVAAFKALEPKFKQYEAPAPLFGEGWDNTDDDSNNNSNNNNNSNSNDNYYYSNDLSNSDTSIRPSSPVELPKNSHRSLSHPTQTQKHIILYSGPGSISGRSFFIEVQQVSYENFCTTIVLLPLEPVILDYKDVNRYCFCISKSPYRPHQLQIQSTDLLNLFRIYVPNGSDLLQFQYEKKRALILLDYIVEKRSYTATTLSVSYLLTRRMDPPYDESDLEHAYQTKEVSAAAANVEAIYPMNINTNTNNNLSTNDLSESTYLPNDYFDCKNDTTTTNNNNNSSSNTTTDNNNNNNNDRDIDELSDEEQEVNLEGGLNLAEMLGVELDRVLLLLHLYNNDLERTADWLLSNPPDTPLPSAASMKRSTSRVIPYTKRNLNVNFCGPKMYPEERSEKLQPRSRRHRQRERQWEDRGVGASVLYDSMDMSPYESETKEGFGRSITGRLSPALTNVDAWRGSAASPLVLPPPSAFPPPPGVGEGEGVVPETDRIPAARASILDDVISQTLSSSSSSSLQSGQSGTPDVGVPPSSPRRIIREFLGISDLDK